jgi:sulfane dehydrogenase subunit SoxC
MDCERDDEKTAAIEEALGRIGERLSESEAASELCECRQGMFALAATRRHLFGGAGLIAVVGMTGMLPRTAAAKAPPGAIEYPVPDDSTKEQGRMMGEDGGYGSRSQFESEVRWANPARAASFTPLQNGYGVITPSGLHYERHHGGIPNIDPARHRLVLHGLVDRPMNHEGAGANRTAHAWPSVDFRMDRRTTVHAAAADRPQARSRLGPRGGGRRGGHDAQRSTIDKCLSDALVVFAQNGEAIRPEQGYPMRLFLPGWEGNISIKWLRRLEVSDKPYYTREETSKYTDLITKTGKSRMFTFTMEAKSVITFPSGEMKLPGAGFYELTGLAWSGRGKIARVEVSTDGGKNWSLAALQDPVLPICQTRFRFPWIWDGTPAVIQSRATDETGYSQPTHQQLIEERGPLESGSLFYHMNAIQSWAIAPDGSVKNVHPLG